jgi:hypothetical protein
MAHMWQQSSIQEKADKLGFVRGNGASSAERAERPQHCETNVEFFGGKSDGTFGGSAEHRDSAESAKRVCPTRSLANPVS